MSAPRLIDIDSHVLEPPDLWVENIEAKYKDRALRFEKDEKGWEYMCVDNAHHHGYFLDGGIFGRAGAGQPDRPHPIRGLSDTWEGRVCGGTASGRLRPR